MSDFPAIAIVVHDNPIDRGAALQWRTPAGWFLSRDYFETASAAIEAFARLPLGMDSDPNNWRVYVHPLDNDLAYTDADAAADRMISDTLDALEMLDD